MYAFNQQLPLPSNVTSIPVLRLGRARRYIPVTCAHVLLVFMELNAATVRPRPRA